MRCERLLPPCSAQRAIRDARHWYAAGVEWTMHAHRALTSERAVQFVQTYAEWLTLLRSADSGTTNMVAWGTVQRAWRSL